MFIFKPIRSALFFMVVNKKIKGKSVVWLFDW